ncbi:hypothetical protein AMTRI_Chr03g54570 [Amborella trichopoda]
MQNFSNNTANILNFDSKHSAVSGIKVPQVNGVEYNKYSKENMEKSSIKTMNSELTKPVRISKSQKCKSTVSLERSGKSNMVSSENGRIKSSNRGKSYGGCIPSILQALETVQNLDDALNPWEDSLSRKERSIILKEQTNWARALEIFQWFKKKGCYELNVIHYNIMLRILGKSRRWGELRMLWDEMGCAKIVPTNATYGTLINAYSKAGLKEEALLWLEEMKKQGLQPDEVTLGTVVQTFKKAGEFARADKFFKRWSSGEVFMENTESNSESQVGSCEVLEINGDLKDNTVIEREKQENRRRSSVFQKCSSSYTYNTLIDTYGKAGQLQEASNTFNQMLREGIIPTTVTFNTMIHICGNYGHLEESDALLLKMEELRCSPDTRTYNILISLHARNDNINAAARYFLKMKAAGLKPDLVSYRTLVYAFSIRQMVGEVESLLSEIDKEGLHIDEYTQSAVTRMYVDIGMIEKALSWFEKSHRSGELSSECYSANIDAFGEHGYWKEAEKVFECSIRRPKLSVLEFNVMIKAYGNGKMYDKACDLIDLMEDRGVFPDKCTYNSLVQILSCAELPDKAIYFVRKMQKEGFVNDCVPYCAVISSFARVGKTENAEDMYKEMVGFGVQPDVIVFGTLVNAFAELGCVKEATYYFDSMKSAGFSGNYVIYNSLIKLYTKVRYLHEAQEIFKLQKLSDEGPDTYSSNCMIDLYSEQLMVSQAEEIYQSLKLKGEANEFSYAMMLCLYKKIGRFGDAVCIAREMHGLGLLTDRLSYNNVIGLYASDGSLREAVETFNHMIKSGIEPDYFTFKSLGMVLIKGGASKEAVNNLNSAWRKNPQESIHSWMATLCYLVGMYDEALKSQEKQKCLFVSV